MKNLLKAAIFIATIIVISVVLLLLFVYAPQGDVAFIGNLEYLKLFLNSGIFWAAIYNTYGGALGLSFIVIALSTLVRHLLKVRTFKSFKFYTPFNIALSGVVAFVWLLMNKVRLFGLPMGVYDPNTLVSPTAPSVTASVSVIEVLIALQIAVFTAFVFWLVELLIGFIKSKKTQ